ncbi:FAD-dependent monooxygenase [Streptomyces sp. NPDC127072]|uniref:FAD-dependent monooxygenase n=1 Tax=Streptomyces sp. NPDC127072 TaxID=3347129 RepID=UPI00365A8254
MWLSIQPVWIFLYGVVGVVGGPQVVVVGGGPVGLVVACELAGFGVDVVVVEAEGGVSEWPKATTVHARTAQSLVRRGYLGDSEGGNSPRTGVDRGSVSVGFHFAGIPGLAISGPAGEPGPVLKCDQAELVSGFEKRARALGVTILRGHRAVGVREAEERVRVEMDGPGGRVDLLAEFVVGADGARSLVREAAAFGSRTYPATVSALAGDVRLQETGALVAGWHRTPRGWIVVKELGERRVRLRTLNCAGAYEGRHQPPTLAELHDEVSWIAGRDIGMDEPRWLSRFSDFCRLVESYRKGRILLAGDAAHVHFPIGGQGLSTGLLDAMNLGWKLALTVRGAAGEGLLDSYDRERRPAAQRVIDHTRAQLALMRPDAGLDPLRALFRELMAGASAESGVLASMVSAQDTVVPPWGPDASPWEGRFLENLALDTAEGRTDVIGLLGKGLPLLLLFGEGAEDFEEQARAWAGLLRVVRAEPVQGLPCEALLVRPDGYVGWAAGGGGLATALRAYFGEGEGACGGVAALGAACVLPGAVS